MQESNLSPSPNPRLSKREVNMQEKDEPKNKENQNEQSSSEPCEQPEADIETKLSHAQAEAAELKEKYLRALADFENLKRRSEREKEALSKFAVEKLLKDLLPVLDSFDKALNEQANSLGQNDDTISVETLLSGMKLVHKQLLDTLAQHGVKPVEAKNKPFDPQWHQAIHRVDDPEVHEETVRDEYQKGYTLHDRLLRAAMVSVAVPSANKNEEHKDEASQS